MVSLQQYIEYFKSLQSRVSGVRSVQIETIDEETGRALQNLKLSECPALIVTVPTAECSASSADAMSWRNRGSFSVFTKYDPQRRGAVDAEIETQPVMEDVINLMVADMAEGCQMLDGLDLRSMAVIPESGVYKTLAGWTCGFTFDL